LCQQIQARLGSFSSSLRDELQRIRQAFNRVCAFRTSLRQERQDSARSATRFRLFRRHGFHQRSRDDRSSHGSSSRRHGPSESLPGHRRRSSTSIVAFTPSDKLETKFGYPVTANIAVQDQTTAKLQPKFIGPFKISEFVSDNTVRLDFTPRFQHLKFSVYNIKWLRPHLDRDPSFELLVDRPEPLPTRQGLEYEVEQILAKRKRHVVVLYNTSSSGPATTTLSSFYSEVFSTCVGKAKFWAWTLCTTWMV